MTGSPAPTRPRTRQVAVFFLVMAIPVGVMFGLVGPWIVAAGVAAAMVGFPVVVAHLEARGRTGWGGAVISLVMGAVIGTLAAGAHGSYVLSAVTAAATALYWAWHLGWTRPRLVVVLEAEPGWLTSDQARRRKRLRSIGQAIMWLGFLAWAFVAAELRQSGFTGGDAIAIGWLPWPWCSAAIRSSPRTRAGLMSLRRKWRGRRRTPTSPGSRRPRCPG